jgi:hypothetical protein
VWLSRFPWVVLTLGSGLLALFEVGSSASMRYGLLILWGQGVALLRLNILPMRASIKTVDNTGLAIAQFQTIRMFGGLVGLIISSSIFNNVFSRTITNSMLQLTGALAPLKDASNAVRFIDSLGSLQVSVSTLDQVLDVYLKCLRMIFYVITGLSALGLVSSILLDEISLKSRELGSQRFEN